MEDGPCRRPAWDWVQILTRHCSDWIVVSEIGPLGTSKRDLIGLPLVAQCMRIHLPTQGAGSILVQEDPTGKELSIGTTTEA